MGAGGSKSEKWGTYEDQSVLVRCGMEPRAGAGTNREEYKAERRMPAPTLLMSSGVNSLFHLSLTTLTTLTTLSTSSISITTPHPASPARARWHGRRSGAPAGMRKRGSEQTGPCV